MVTSWLSRVRHYINNNKNNSLSKSSSSNNFFNIKLILAVWCGLTLATAVNSAAIYSNVDFLTNPNFEPICKAQQEHFVESDGKESSLILEFNGGAFAEKKRSCTRILSAPPNYGFIVRLILPKLRRGHNYASTTSAESKASGKPKISATSALNEMTSFIEKLNASALGRTCPVSIFSSIDPHTPQWRVDPCQLEDTAPEMEDPVRLFHGRVRIVWENRHNTLQSKLMVTVLGKGEQCRSEKKHPCLKIGDEPILCISKDLVCDGIRHCPYSNEYDSDEDYSMCWKRRRFGEPMPPTMESDIFEHLALEVFRNLFSTDVPTVSEATPVSATPDITPAGANGTTLYKVEENIITATGSSSTVTNSSTTNETVTTAIVQLDNSTEHTVAGRGRKNSTRMGLNSDLSKYGPWGYLMLGMLLCGGALLICGLWVACCRLSLHIQTIRSLSASASQNAANLEHEAAQAAANGAAGGGEHPSSNNSPPNYDELDPPPAYSVLFPIQKAASNTTLSSLAAGISPPASVAAATTAASPEAASATTSTAGLLHLQPADSALASSSHINTH